MLFRAKMEPRCLYCVHGNPLDESHMTCLKRGVVAKEGSCRKFEYDPLKRVPPRAAAPSFDRLKDEDFSL